MTQSHTELPKFEPGRDQASIGTKWTKWLEVWELYLPSRENDTINNDTYEYVKSKTLKPLFLLNSLRMNSDVGSIMPGRIQKEGIQMTRRRGRMNRQI